MKRSEYLKIATEPFTVRTHEFIADRLVAEGVLEADEPEPRWVGEQLLTEADYPPHLMTTNREYLRLSLGDPNYTHGDIKANLQALARRSNLLLELEQWADGLSFYGDELSQEDGARVLIPAALIRKLWGEA